MTDYTPSGKPEDNTRGISKQVRDEFVSIQDAINSKVDKTSVILSRVYDTIAGFSSSGLSNEDVIFFLGRDAVNDGGGGWFTFWSASVQPADGGLVFAPTGGGRLYRDGWTVIGFNGPINVAWFGAVGDGVTDDASAIQDAINAANAFTGGGRVVFPPSGVYLIGTALSLKSNVILWLYGATLKIKDSTNIDAIEIVAGASRVGVMGGEIDGNKANNLTSGTGIINDSATQFTYCTIRDIYIHDCRTDNIWLGGVDASNPSKYITVNGCTLEDAGAAGLSGDWIEEFAFTGNVAINNGTHNIGLIGRGKYGTITGNTASGSGLADNFTAYNNACRYLTVSGNVSRGGANNGIHFGGQDIIISDNTVYDPAMHGIVVYSHASADANNVTVSGNVVNSAGMSGIWSDKNNEFSITGNTVVSCTDHGILLDGTNDNGVVAGNTCKGNGADGIRLENCTKITVSGNTSVYNTSDGIQLANSVDCTVSGNTFKENATAVLETGTSDWNFYSGNNCRGNVSDVITLTGSHSQWGDNLNGGTNSVASAATVTLPVYTNYITITGTTNITSITASWNRRVVRLRFDDVLTLTKGSNLKLNSNFVTSNNDMIELQCDGTDWYQVSPPSVN